MATFKSVDYLGSAQSDDETFALSIAGVASGDTVLLAVILVTSELSEGTFTMPDGWVNAIDAEQPLARVDSDDISIIPFVYTGVPPEADVILDGISIRYFVAIVTTLAEGEVLTGFAAHYSGPTTPDEDVTLPYTAPGDGGLGVLAISEWLSAG